MHDASPLTALGDEDKSFQSVVLRFARERIAPHVRAMDEAADFSAKDLLREIFEPGPDGD